MAGQRDGAAIEKIHHARVAQDAQGPAQEVIVSALA